LLVENRERLVSKEEIIDKVWDGRVVSDARRRQPREIGAAGSGRRRQVAAIRAYDPRPRLPIRRECQSVTDTAIWSADSAQTAAVNAAGVAVQHVDTISRPSLAVLPFRLIGDGGRYAALAVALPDELITELSRLRWLFITARGSSFRLRAPDTDFSEIGALLRVRYCLWGTVEVSDQSVVVAVELVDTADGGIVWAERFSGRIDDVHSMRENIRARVLMALEIQIPATRPLARATAPSKTSMPGRPTTSACSTCIASIVSITAPPALCSASGCPRSPIRARSRGPVVHSLPNRIHAVLG